MLYTCALFCVLFCGRFSYILMTVMCMQLVHVLHVHSLRITLQWSSLWLRHTALTRYDKYGAIANSTEHNGSDQEPSATVHPLPTYVSQEKWCTSKLWDGTFVDMQDMLPDNMALLTQLGEFKSDKQHPRIS